MMKDITLCTKSKISYIIGALTILWALILSTNVDNSIIKFFGYVNVITNFIHGIAVILVSMTFKNLSNYNIGRIDLGDEIFTLLEIKMNKKAFKEKFLKCFINSLAPVIISTLIFFYYYQNNPVSIFQYLIGSNIFFIITYIISKIKIYKELVQ